jgi:hypothetical protein
MIELKSLTCTIENVDFEMLDDHMREFSDIVLSATSSEDGPSRRSAISSSMTSGGVKISRRTSFSQTATGSDLDDETIVNPLEAPILKSSVSELKDIEIFYGFGDDTETREIPFVADEVKKNTIDIPLGK